MPANILVVDDEPDLLATVGFALSRAGFAVQNAVTGAEAIRMARSEPHPDLVVLDLLLPDVSGTEVCRRLRAAPETERTPILFLTARDDEIDRVVGFELGADDYMGKPFEVRELVLRVEVLLRRSGTPPAAFGSESIAFGRLAIDLAHRRVRIDGSPVVLTPIEFRLLHTLASRRGRVQTRSALQTVLGQGAAEGSRAVDTHIQRLRGKLGRAAEYIHTVRGIGYRFADTPGGE